jgi:hypothetical protein
VIKSGVFGLAEQVDKSNLRNVLLYFNIEAKKSQDEYAKALLQQQLKKTK